jgi:N-acetylneuraminic acid mutarotase
MLSGTLLAFFRTEAPTKVSHRTLTFAERVAYQRAIEQVYWRHRIWPKEQPDPKPSLDVVMSQAQLEKKVEDYLCKSEELEEHWERPITGEQLQTEMERIARRTKQPEVLRELFEALGNDPLVIAECLARPVLAERMLATVASLKQPLDPSRATPERQAAATMAAATANYTLPAIASPSAGCTNDTWTPTRTTNAADGRYNHTAVWTGSDMIVWGGYGGSYFNTGGRYNPSTDSWTATSTASTPAARRFHTAVWTGSEMVVWGGGDGLNYFNTGGRYNPSTDSWTATSTNNAPDARSFHTAVWTGSEMIVWGGTNGVVFPNGLNTGGRYNPSTDSWTASSTTNAPEPRYWHSAVWTGTEMIIWGGTDLSSNFDSGGRYNPDTDSWTSTSTTSAPAARHFHTAVWTGSQMIVWGGWDGSFLNSGGRYNPSTDSWTATGTVNAPSGRYYHTAVWTGSQMIVWGGQVAVGWVNTGGRYNPGTDSWTATSTTNAPSARYYHTAIWTSSEMIVWGGYDSANFLNTGGRYCAQFGPTPTPTPSPTASPTPTATPTATPCTGRCAPTPRPRPTPAPRP